ncbi:MAG: hypothetical protein APR63_12740 [Desulfuromonas sp. SDB]|nr:MAG: hypothetical protein APR63_12740 [Desulfuromonas sp. SDB]
MSDQQNPSYQELKNQLDNIKKSYEQEQSLLTQIINNSAVGITVVDAQGKITFANQRAIDILGLTKNQLSHVLYNDPGWHITDFNGNPYPEEKLPFNLVKKNNQPVYDIRHTITKPDGDKIYLSINGSPVYNKQDEFNGMIATVEDITRQEKVEKALQESEARFRGIFENISIGMYRTTPDGQILMANSALIEMLGYSSFAELSQVNLNEEGYAPEYPRSIFKHLIETNGKVSGLESAWIKSDGTTIFIRENAKCIKDKDGNILYYEGTTEDITKRKLAEQALEKNEKFLKDVFDAIQDGLSILSPDLEVIKTNRWMEHKYSSQIPLVGKKCYSVYQNRDDPCPWCPSIKTLKDGMTHTEVVPFPCSENPSGWIELSAFPVKNKQGEVINVIEYVKDITDRIKAERYNRERQLYLESVVSSAPDAIITLDGHNRILDWNQGAINLFGFDKKEVLGKNIDQLIARENLLEQAKRFTEQVAQRGTLQPTETVRYHKDGTKLNVIVSGAQIVVDGDLVGIVAIYTDITELKKVQQERVSLKQQFNQVQRLESIGRLAGGIAHDLNNLLSPILGYSEMLLEDAVEEEERGELLEEIIKASNRARDLVGQLLAFSRKQNLEFKNIDLNSLLQNFEKLLRRTIREDISINLKLAPSLPLINGDSGQLEQVLMNLAVNAQDAMPQGGKLSIETSTVELDENYAAKHEGVEPGPYVMVLVSDTGYGMDNQTKEHIFEPFFTTKEKERGTGLGLATVYGIVKQHMGNIWVYSEPDKGTSFKIYFPPSTKLTKPEHQHTAKKVNLQGSENILLVEDDQHVRNLALSILKLKGYNVISAESGRKAVDLLKDYKGKIDLILTDVVMPEINGRQLYEIVAKTYPQVKVLYMSGYSENVIAHHGIIDASINFIQKPFSLKALAIKVREVLDK